MAGVAGPGLRCRRRALRTPARRYERRPSHALPPAEAPHLDGTARADKFGDDPGFLNLDEPDEVTLARYVDQLDTGTLPGFNAAKIF